MTDDNNTSGTVPEESGASSSEGQQETVGQSGSESQQPESLTLDEINQALGKNFKDKESALKSWKDTYRFVGKANQEGKEDDQGNQQRLQDDYTRQELEKMRKDLFFEQNPGYKPYRHIIERMGDDPQQVVETNEFKEVFEKAKGYDEVQNQKSVLESNPRLNESRTSVQEAQQEFDEAKNAVAQGDITGYKKKRKSAQKKAMKGVTDIVRGS